MNPEFWRGKRVLITGHNGFKGSWMAIWLQSIGVDLTGYSLGVPTIPSLYEEGNIQEGMSNIFGDVRDFEKLLSVVDQFKPEIIFHMAAQSLVLKGYENPIDTYSTNVMGTVNILECSRRCPGVKAVINVTTDKCYENKEWPWGYRECDSIGGFDPYSNSKGCSELITNSYRSSYFNPQTYSAHGVALATVRAGNVIGGGDWAENRLIPDILSSFQGKQAVIIRSPESIRPWQHVLEPLRGYLMLAERLYQEGASFSEAWNFGPRDEDVQTVAWIVNEMSNLWGEDATWICSEDPGPHEAHFLKLDISKAKSKLNWYPRLGLRDSLSFVVDWSKRRSAGIGAREITESQIAQYQKME